MKTFFTFSFIFSLTISSAQIINFSDNNFKTALIEYGVDSNGDQEIDEDEAAAFTKLDLSDKDINNVEGIEYFSSLTNLKITKNSLTVLDLRTLENLNALYCGFNQIVELKVDGLKKLRNISCNNNQLTELNVNGLIALVNLYFDHNQVSEIDLQGLDNLERFSALNNKFKGTFTFENLESLTSVTLSRNELTELILASVPELSSIAAEQNMISNLDVSELSKLRILRLRVNEIADLQLQNNPELVDVNISSNQLKELDLGNNTKLQYLTLNDNALTELDISHQKSLTDFSIITNQLTEIDFSNNENLKNVFIGRNSIETVDLSNLKSLEIFWCEFNALTELDIRSNKLFTNLYAVENDLRTIQIKNSSEETRLDLKGNDNLEYICADATDFDIINEELAALGMTQVNVDDLCETISSTEVLLNDNSVSIFPNPSMDLLNITTDEPIKKIDILDMQGKLVYSKEIHNTRRRIQLSLGLTNVGQYIVTITTEKGLYTRQLSVMH